MVTCTDLVTLAGNNPDMCFAKYGCVPVRTRACHELGNYLLQFFKKTTPLIHT